MAVLRGMPAMCFLFIYSLYFLRAAIGTRQNYTRTPENQDFAESGCVISVLTKRKSLVFDSHPPSEFPCLIHTPPPYIGLKIPVFNESGGGGG